MAGYERCQRRDCVRPTEAVVVIVRVSLTARSEDATLQLALCGQHADEALYLVDGR